MNLVTPFSFSPRLVFLFFICLVFSVFGPNRFLLAEDTSQLISSSKTRTIIADLLMVDGNFYIVRGDRGEIQIEVTPETTLSEKFTFGDRIKAVVLPNNVAQTITRAAADDPVGITINKPSEPPAAPIPTETHTTTETDSDPPPPAYEIPKVRIIIADLLMVDGSFYIIHSEYGEIQIEITSETELSEDFKFGDKIKARVTPTDKALSVVRAGKDEPIGIQDEAAPPVPSSPVSPLQTSPTTTPKPTEKKSQESVVESTPAIRVIVADVLMVEGDFIIVRGERGEIQIEVTPKTTTSETFDYGDRIKAEILPNDKALTIERASPDDPIGITTK